jgi:hypothetical protein
MLRPSVFVLSIALTSLVVGVVVVFVARLMGEHRTLDLQLLAGLTLCGLVAAIAFGAVREYVALPRWLGPWVLGSVASVAFYGCMVVLAGLKHGRSPVRTVQDFVLFLLLAVVSGLGLGAVIRLEQRRAGPA